jgi:heme iron utilization protein
MAVSSHRAIAIGISAVFFILAALPATANPLCASPEQRQTIQSVLTESPKSSPAKIASATGVSEAAVVHAMTTEARTPVGMLDFERVWQALTEWEDALVIVLSSGSIFELLGPLPEGETERGYFNFGSPDSSNSGRLKVDRLAAIYLLSTDGDNSETHQVAFYDHDGRRVFSVYVPRDDEGALRTQPHSRFLRMRRDYGAVAKRSLLTDTSCLWGLNTYQHSIPVEDRN